LKLKAFLILVICVFRHIIKITLFSLNSTSYVILMPKNGEFRVDDRRVIKHLKEDLKVIDDFLNVVKRLIESR